MSHATTPAAGDAHASGHEDPMSHVPPGSIWPLLIGAALIFASFGALILMLKDGLQFVSFGGEGKVLLTIGHGVGRASLAIGSFGLLAALMGWCHQIIREKPLSHDPMQQQQDLKQFILQFLGGEAAVFGAVFAYFYHRKIWSGGDFGPPHGMHFGGPTVAYATLILISSSITCEIAHRALEVGQRGLAKLMLVGTILLGVVFLGFQGFEYGELYQAGFTPVTFAATPGLQNGASFAGLFYAGTGFHGLHVAIGIVMLFMVLFRLEVGHFKGHRNFAMIAASWYWHFVDIVWILLFITIYVVA
jgi:cytochrome c oxidase subunit III